jgi:hypothetical protein
MAKQQVGLFYRSGAGIKSGERLLGLMESLRSELRPAGRFGVWLTDKRVQMGVDDIFERWVSGATPVSVTDLHFRDTPFERRVRGAEVDSINLLRSKHDEIARQEMMTLVISSRGAFTDSHTDDPDGYNHCLVGRKLWVVWDTYEGDRVGLQDGSRTNVKARAQFAVDAWLSLPSAAWFVMEPGKTVFLPGRLAHKVVTLEAYIGFGAFYVCLPDLVPTLARWCHHGPLWSSDSPVKRKLELVERIAGAAMRQIHSIRRPSARRMRDRWGYGHLSFAVMGPNRQHQIELDAFLRSDIGQELRASTR